MAALATPLPERLSFQGKLAACPTTTRLEPAGPNGRAPHEPAPMAGIRRRSMVTASSCNKNHCTRANFIIKIAVGRIDALAIDARHRKSMESPGLWNATRVINA
jgi:hypothetical protein